MLDQKNRWWTEHRYLVFTAGMVVLFGLLGFRLLSMQLIIRPDFLEMATTNRIRTEVIEPTRGRIYDRHNRLLVENRPSHTLYALPWTIKANPATITFLASVLELEENDIRQRIGSHGWNTFYPTTLQRDLPFDKLAYLETVRVDYPGILFRFEAKRSYPYPETVHILGYVGERSTDNVRKLHGRIGLVGKSGIEIIYEKWLGGEPGVLYQQVDASGRITEILDDPPPVEAKPGWDIYLNIDAGLQRYAYELLGDRTGSVVALNPQNGELLVLLSLPDYDPSLFAGVMTPETWEAIINDPGHPLLNRAIQGLYPPGSTFKMAVLTAAIEEGFVNNDFQVTCYGGLQLGRRWFKCWKKGGHGKVNQYKAIQQSCDVFFYNLGLMLGVERMEKYCNVFGFGKLSGIDLDNELTGIIPSVKYLDNKYGTGKWTRGQLANISIGQGDVLVTPLQLAIYTAAISTGKLVKPRLTDKLVNPIDGEVHKIEATSKDLKLSAKCLRIIREGMRMVVNESGGTAYWLRQHDIEIAGKTGTSQNPHGEDHALFVAYAPVENPQIAVAVVIEHGEHGSTSAAPVAVKLIKRYLYDLFPGPRPVFKPKPVELAKTDQDSLQDTLRVVTDGVD